MRKISLFATLVATVIALGVTTMSAPLADADAPPPPCMRKVFKTQMIKEACANKPGKPGGQAIAKAAMRKFASEHGLQCIECHVGLAPNYPNKDTGFKRYKELSGK